MTRRRIAFTLVVFAAVAVYLVTPFNVFEVIRP